MRVVGVPDFEGMPVTRVATAMVGQFRLTLRPSTKRDCIGPASSAVHGGEEREQVVTLLDPPGRGAQLSCTSRRVYRSFARSDDTGSPGRRRGAPSISRAQREIQGTFTRGWAGDSLVRVCRCVEGEKNGEVWLVSTSARGFGARSIRRNQSARAPGIHDYLCLRANDQVDGGSDSAPVGVCFESARSIHGHCGRTVSERTVQRALDHLAALGWIKRWMERGKHGNYPILIARYSVQDARGNEYRISALETDDWRHPRLDLVVSADCCPSVALASVKEGQLPLVPSVASETSEIPVSANCCPSVAGSSTYKGRDRDRDRDKKSSGAAHQSDPRHQAVKTAYLAGTARAGIANPDWNGADGKALNDFQLPCRAERVTRSSDAGERLRLSEGGQRTAAAEVSLHRVLPAFDEVSDWPGGSSRLEKRK